MDALPKNAYHQYMLTDSLETFAMFIKESETEKENAIVTSCFLIMLRKG